MPDLLLDALFVVGITVAVAGFALISLPAAMIVAGACLAGVAVLAGRR